MHKGYKMKSIVLLTCVSVTLMSNPLENWNAADSEVNTSAKKAENARMCSLYKDKISKYKETMRDDELAHATLSHYEVLENKYCKG